MRYLLIIFIGLFVGFGGAWYAASEEAPVIVRKTIHPEPKMEIFGFQPFWLLNEADTNYSSYTSTLTYFGLQIDDDGHIRKNNNEAELEPGWNNLHSDRIKNLLVNAKEDGVSLSLAVQNANEESILLMVEDPETSARNLVDDVEPLMQEYEFTDLNLDIESFQDVSVETQQAFTLFVQTVHKEVKLRKLGTVSIDITPMSLLRQRLTSVSQLEPYVDSMVLMAYDFLYTGSYISGATAPLDGSGKVREYDVQASLNVLLQSVPKEKVLLGMPTYGYEWETLSDVPGAAVIPGSGKIITAKQVENLLYTCTDCKKGIDPISKQPYVIKKEDDYFRQLFYADKESVKETFKIAKTNGIKGIAVWAYGYETSTMRDELAIYR